MYICFYYDSVSMKKIKMMMMAMSLIKNDKDGVDDTMNNDGSKYHHDDDLPCVTV